MFRGLHSINLDAKGRLAIPAKYRDALTALCAGHLVVTVTIDSPCLSIYPLCEWELIQAKLDALPSLNKDAVRIKRLLIGYATDIELDSSGRILLPASLREPAHLDKEVVLMGQGKKLELWNKADWDGTRESYLAANVSESLSDELLGLSL